MVSRVVPPWGRTLRIEGAWPLTEPRRCASSCLVIEIYHGIPFHIISIYGNDPSEELVTKARANFISLGISSQSVAASSN